MRDNEAAKKVLVADAYWDELRRDLDTLSAESTDTERTFGFSIRLTNGQETRHWHFQAGTLKRLAFTLRRVSDIVYQQVDMY